MALFGIGDSAPLRRAGLVLGIGMGGFVDGIGLHQIAQLHSMLSARASLDTKEGMRINMIADGLFHAACLAVVMVGVVLLFRAGQRPGTRWSGAVLGGSMVTGWGVFNIVEGVIDHHLLALHHVVERLGLSVWDWLFLACSVVLIGAGELIARCEPAVITRS